MTHREQADGSRGKRGVGQRLGREGQRLMGEQEETAGVGATNWKESSNDVREPVVLMREWEWKGHGVRWGQGQRRL